MPVSQPLARLYDLALRTLDEQERRVEALRGRLGPVLAAAALGTSLLSGPMVGGAHPATLGGKLCLAIAVGSLLVTVGAAFRLLVSRKRPVLDLDHRELATELARDGLLDDEAAFYTTMIARLGGQLKREAETSARLSTAFTAMLWGILVMLCGLALAALVG